MFRRTKSQYKAKLEHKLYLARENPEPVFDLSDCHLGAVPHGIYSLCRVFLKHSLYLQQNLLSSLSGGGELRDLANLEVLDISCNLFTHLPDEIYLLQNLQDLNVSSNKLKQLPPTLSQLPKLQTLNLSNNNLKSLPENFGQLSQLKNLNISGNDKLKHLPKSIYKAQCLQLIQLDAYNFQYPPQEVASAGCEAIMEFVAEEQGCEYHKMEPNLKDFVQVKEDETDHFQAKILELEQIKFQKMQDFLDIERLNELKQRKELELANLQKIDREKLLAEISAQQDKFDKDLNEIHKLKEYERFRLIEQLQEAENNADITINQLLSINREPLLQLLEQEKLQEEELFRTASKQDNVRRGSIFLQMEGILQEESRNFELYNQARIEASRNVLETYEFTNDCK